MSFCVKKFFMKVGDAYKLIKADYAAARRALSGSAVKCTFLGMLNFFITYPGFRNVVAYRLHFTSLAFLGWIIRRTTFDNLYITTGFIDAGLFPFHCFSTIINAEKIGRNFICFQNVTIGVKGGRRPVIGDNVVVNTGAVVCGGIKIGDNVVVGANSFVDKDVPANCVVAGCPAKVIKRLEV